MNFQIILFNVILLARYYLVYSFQNQNLINFNHFKKSKLNSKNFLQEFWDEIVEFSTLGPSERKLLKLKREKAKNTSYSDDRELDESDNDEEWMKAFKQATEKESVNTNEIDFDGYALRDLIVSKFNVPLDVDFQRMPGPTIYCSVLPMIGYGSKRSRHDTELDYLMHLQGVVEVLYKYDNLDYFIDFITSTTRIPKPGKDSVPVRLILTDEQLQKILSK